MSESPTHPQLQDDPNDQSETQGTVEDVSAAGTLGPPQCPERGCSPPNAMSSTPLSQSHGRYSSQEEEGTFSYQALPDMETLIGYAVHGNLGNLVAFLFHKYQMKMPTTKTEILQSVCQDYEQHFSEIFRLVSECLYLVFGIDVKEVDPPRESYVLIRALGLTYDGMVDDDQSFPKTSLLIMVLGVIFLQGNCAREEVIWEVLSGIGVRAGEEHFIYGEPRKFVTKDLVQEQYLAYEQVPNSDPPRYELLWGPRAHTETSKMKVLEFLAKLDGTTPSAFSVSYEEALRDEEERAELRGPPE